jgi:kynurenine formamidase
MTAEATRHLIAKGVRMMGCDAITFDPPVKAMFEQKQFWEARLMMNEEDYWHLENLTNLDELPPHGFKLAVFTVKWIGTTAAPVRALAILRD